MHPLVSIVMPSLNQVAFMPAAVHSVLSQSYPHLELVVMDGGSSDGTQAWLAQRQAQDARLRWVSAPDSGPAEALNKALRLSRGTHLGWLNSDDVYTPGAVQRALQALLGHPEWLMVYGHGEHIDEAGHVLDSYPTRAPPAGMADFAQGCFICQPTVFFKRSMSLLLGPLDQSLKTSFDLDYWLRAFSAFPQRVGFVDAMQAQSRLHVGCITLRLRRTVMLEGMQLLARHLGHAPKEWFLTYAIELLALPDRERGVQDLQEHLNEALAQATPWLRLSELPGLKQELNDLLSKI
jgi:glycosyltransferase involved in cell wall biosynthesis